MISNRLQNNTVLSICLAVIIGTITSCGTTKSIESIECIRHSNGTAISSESFKLEIKALDIHGDTRTSMSDAPFSKSKFGLSHYKISIVGGTRVMGSDVIKIDQTNPPTAYHIVQVIAELKQRSDIVNELKFAVSHKGSIRKDFSATSAGSNASDVRVSVKMVSNSDYSKLYHCSLYQVSIERNNSRELFYMSEKGSNLEIVNRGAKGPTGMKGVNGVDQATLKKKRDGQPGGSGGSGGSGGTVTLILDPSAKSFLKLCSIDNRGGDGGDGGEGGKGGIGGDRVLIDGKKEDGSDRLLIDGKKPNGTSGARGNQGASGSNGPALIVINRDVPSFGN